MEALKKLEKVQTMLSFMQENGISSNHPESDRFLADFLLFMVQPCGELNMEKKCHLVSEHLPKISERMLEEASVLVSEEEIRDDNFGHPQKSNKETKKDSHLSKPNVEDLTVVGISSMEQANSTLEDFCRSYFMFHGMDVNRPHLIFKFLPVLFFTESYIYQLDSMNEKDLLSMKEIKNPEDSFSFLNDTCGESEVEVGKESMKGFVDVASYNSFAPLQLILQYHGLLTERIERELKSGHEYWALERKLCHALLNKKKISVEDVTRAIHQKSFDYRVLNLLMYQLRGEQVNELHMEFLSISELLVEISDDLYDYEDDVMKNSFNILRMFIRIYGSSVAPSMLAKYIIEAEDKFRLLLEALGPDLSSSYLRRCEEATAEGGKASAHALGTWNIPSVITDEESYRSEVLNSRNSSTNQEKTGLAMTAWR